MRLMGFAALNPSYVARPSFGACLAMGIATMAGWVKPLTDNT
jgi:hypothetical protein